jgi:hypothetical protein
MRLEDLATNYTMGTQQGPLRLILSVSLVVMLCHRRIEQIYRIDLSSVTASLPGNPTTLSGPPDDQLQEVCLVVSG